MHLLRLGFGLRMRTHGGDNLSKSGMMGTGASFAKEITSPDNKSWMQVAKKSASAKALRSRTNTNTVLIYAVALVALIFAFSSYSDTYGVSAMPRCPPCPNGDCPEPPEGACLHGIVTNFCGRRVCAKGPGEVCGTGMFKMLGTCGDGMYCNCGRCIGCSLFTMTCYDKTCTK